MAVVFQNTLKLRTPEGISFSLRLAGVPVRLAAWFIDALVMGAILTALTQLLPILGVLGSGFRDFVLTIAIFLVQILYAATLEWYMRGQTVGKRLLHLRVMDAHGLPLTPAQVLVRNLMRAIDSLPLFYLVGGTACVLSRHYKRLGDMLASTVVVREISVQPPDVAQVLTQKYNSFLTYPHLAARLRQSASPKAAEVALEALLRRDELEPQARRRIYAELVEHFQSLVRFPEELRETLSDEHYLQNVVAVLFPKSFVVS